MNTVARRRLANQHLVAPTLDEAAAVVGALGAVQAQDYSGAKWAIAQRTRRLTEADVERAFTTGAILRTHVLRPTWHFILPADARWMLELTAPRIHAAMAYYLRRHGLDASAVHAGHARLERALRDGHHCTRTELAVALAHAGMDVSSGERVGHLLMQAELDRVIISGPRRGKQFTYALFDERVPAAPRRDRDEALGELTRRYFATRGPAAAGDFAWWSGLTVADAERGIQIADRSLVRETVDGRAYWSARAERRSSRWAPVAHLLPSYDEYFIGFRDRSAVAERLETIRPKRRVDGLIGYGLFVDGQLVGGWRRALDPRVDLELRVVIKLTARERVLVDRAAQRYADFLGFPVRVRERRRLR